MRALFFSIVLLLSGILTAQTIDNPSFKARSGSISNITRIERTPEATKLFIHAIFRPHWWIKEEGDSYLVDTATGVKYPVQKAEGIEFKKETYMPASGEMDYVLYFAPLPKTTKAIHLLSDSDRESCYYDISLVKPKKEKKSLLEAIKGNWYRADISNRWEYGVYDSIVIAHNRIFTNEGIRKNGKNIEVSFKNDKDKLEGTLTFTPQKDGNYAIAINNTNKYLFTRQKSPVFGCIAEKDFTQFFRKDTAYLQGYINGYDPRLGFETGLIYTENSMTREDYPTVVTIHPDGTFDAKIALNYPIESYLNLKDTNLPFYIEPGQTLTIYIDWEDMMARSRARDSDYPLNNTAYMGPSAEISQMYVETDKLISYPYNKLSKAQKELTPNQFKEQIQSTFHQWDQMGDSLARIFNSEKAVHLLKNKIAVEKGRILLDFLMSRDYYAEQEPTNEVLKVKEDQSYYDFLKLIPLDDETMLADNRYDVFTNRFEYMSPLKKAYKNNLLLSDTVTVSYPAKSLLSFLKENGVKLNAEQEALRIKEEKHAGKTIKTTFGESLKESNVISPLHMSEKGLLEKYNKLYSEQDTSTAPEPEVSDEDIDRQILENEQYYWIKGDSIVQLLSGQSKSFLWQMALTRNLKFELMNFKSRAGAQIYIDSLNQYLTYPILKEEANRMLEVCHPKNTQASYQLPEGKATEIFRSIIKAHQGKVLFVDFWATSCGPCRAGIEHTAPLRKQYKNHPEFEFIYITSERDSPEGTYNSYVEKNLKGEVSYRISETEFNYLRQLFKFNGIPHYELVEKDGSIATQAPETHNLNNFLKERFEKSAP